MLVIKRLRLSAIKLIWRLVKLFGVPFLLRVSARVFTSDSIQSRLKKKHVTDTIDQRWKFEIAAALRCTRDSRRLMRPHRSSLLDIDTAYIVKDGVALSVGLSVCLSICHDRELCKYG